MITLILEVKIIDFIFMLLLINLLFETFELGNLFFKSKIIKKLDLPYDFRKESFYIYVR